jgi:predicted dienelactone hydrolase
MNRQILIGSAVGTVLIPMIVWGQSGPVPRLPEPTGTFGIGRVAYHWIDSKRTDPFAAEPARRRELMVYIWYPTAADQKTDEGIYQPGAKQIDAAPGAERMRQSPIWPGIVSESIKSHARDSAPLAPGPRFPVVLFSHGDTVGSFSYTSAIEDLVSHGYIVAAVEHPYSSSAVVFPDGRVILGYNRQRFRGDRPPGTPYFEGVQMAMRDMRQLGEIGAADVRFVVDQLDRLDKADKSSPFFQRLDLRRIAAVGHSLGGMVAVRACQLDARIQACINQDGGTADGVFLAYAGAEPLKQPFLFVEATPPLNFTDQELAARGITRADWDKNANAVAVTQERQLRGGRAGGYKVELRAPGMNHGSFGDTTLSATTPQAAERAVHNLRLTIEITHAFLEKTLEGEANTLFDQPGYSNAEMKIERFEPNP